MNTQRATQIKILLCAAAAVTALALCRDLYQKHQHQQALAQQLQRVQELQARIDRDYEQQSREFAVNLAQWQQQQQAVTELNQQRITQWQQNPVIRERRIITRERLLMQAPESGAAPVAAAPPPPEEIVVERPRPPPQLETVPEPPSPPTKVTISTESIEVELAENTSWQTIAQLLTLILGLYAGIKIINRLTERDAAQA